MSDDFSPVAAIALDVGGSSVKSGVVLADGQIAGQPLTTAIDSAGSAGAILDTFAAVIQGHIDALGGADYCGVGFGFPDPMEYPAGVCWIKGQHKYDALYGLHVGEGIRARVPIGERPVLFRNDAEAAIVGEALFGAGRPYRRLIGVTLGTGLGSSFLVDGVRQASGPGVPEEHGGFLWPLPVLGARADDVFSIRGLTARLRAAGIETDSIREAAALAREQRAVRAVFEQFGIDLAVFLKPYATAFEAEAVLSLGGISGAFDLFGPVMGPALGIPVLPPALGSESALLGAAQLVLPGG